MGKKLYVGNLSYDVSSSDLEALLAPHGTVQSAEVIMDRSTGQSKGFGFVEMDSDAEAQAAIAALNGQEKGGRALKVNEAKPANRAPAVAVDTAVAGVVPILSSARPIQFRRPVGQRLVTPRRLRLTLALVVAAAQATTRLV